MMFLRGDDGVLHVVVIALVSIQCGQELLLDYGDKYWYRREAPFHLGDDVVPVNLVPSKTPWKVAPNKVDIIRAA